MGADWVQKGYQSEADKEKLFNLERTSMSFGVNRSKNGQIKAQSRTRRVVQTVYAMNLLKPLVNDVSMKPTCIVCDDILTDSEFALISDEFKAYPAHADCFDTFESADEFLAFAQNKVTNENMPNLDQHPRPPEVAE